MIVAAKKKNIRQLAGVPILERALGLVEFLSQCSTDIALSELSRRLRIPKNTTYRLLNTLCARGYISRNETELTYRLTRKFVTLICSSTSDAGLIEKALGPMKVLRDQVKETVVISILDGAEGIVLEQVPGLHPFRFVCEPGTRQPLHASASTKAILACYDDKERDAILEGVHFTRYTEHTITAMPDFRREIARTRKLGFGVDHGEALQGVSCVAAPVLDRRQRPLAAITVTGPDERLRKMDFNQVGALVKACAQAISERLA